MASAATNGVADTRFDFKRGFYFAPLDVTITCSTPGSTIAYTIDGSEPSLTHGTLVSAPDSSSGATAVVHIATTTIVRASAFKDGLTPTDIDTQSYIFPRDVAAQVMPTNAAARWVDDPPNGNGASYPADYTIDPFVVSNTVPGYSFTNALLSLPAVSLVMAPDGLFGAINGIYTHPYMEGPAWERATSVEMINPDGSSAFHVLAGSRIHGATSRGNSLTPKHSLRLAFRGQYGAGELDYPLFPDSAEHHFDDLILRACSTDAWPINNALSYLWNNAEATYQRDQWMRDAQLATGHPSPHGLYVHLYLNGLYWGVYNLSERISESWAASYFGGSKTNYDLINWDFSSNHIVVAGSDAAWNQLIQMAVLVPNNPSKFWEMQGLNPDGTRNSRYPVLIDMDNFIDYMLLHIYAVATDWPNRNWYATRIRDSSTTNLDSTGFKFLTWDQEVAVDRLNRVGTWSALTPYQLVNQADTPAQIYDRLRLNAEFRLRFGDRLQKFLLNGGALTVAANRARWGARSNELNQAIVGESARWGDGRRSPSFTREANWLPEQAFTQGTFWPSNDIAAWARFKAVSLYPTVNPPIFSQYGGNVIMGYQLILARQGTNGTIFYTLNGADPRKAGGNVASGALAYSAPIGIFTPLTVRARVKDGTNWSAIVEASFFPPQDFNALVLSEIMYNPPDGTTGYPADGEFVELKNTGTNTLNLSGMTIPAIAWTFPSGSTVGPNQFVVLVKSSDKAKFVAQHPSVPIGGLYSGALDNGGETIALLDVGGHTVFSVTYQDGLPWPSAADGFGFSLVQRGPLSQAPDDGTRWRASSFPGGSPGADDPEPTLARVVINEILSASSAPQVDRIELYNPTASSANISGWFLSDDRSVPAKFRIPAGTIVPPFGYVTFDETQFNAAPGSSNSFALNSSGDDVFLFSADAAGRLTGYEHGVQFGGADPGITFGRYINSVGEELWPAQVSTSFGATNAGPQVGPIVISEINYNPVPGDDEFVELKNISSVPVPLFDPATPTNTWRLSGLGYKFPTNVVVPAGGYVLLVPTNRSIFVAKYSVPPDVLIFGPYSGALQDSGELLSLERRTTNGLGWIVVDEVRYNDKAPWPPAADGGGFSLHRLYLAAFGNDPANWLADEPTPGRPIEEQTPVPPDGTLQLAPIATLSTTNGPQMRLRFTALANMTYSVLWCDDLEQNVWQVLESVPAEPSPRIINIYDDIDPAVPARFYRISSPAQ